MSFQAYLDTIKAKTGKGPAEFKKLAEKKGFLKKGTLAEGVKAGDIVKWLKNDFELGHGHAMALFALFKGIKKEGDKTKFVHAVWQNNLYIDTGSHLCAAFFCT